VGSARARLADADVWQSAEWSDRSPERLRMMRLSCVQTLAAIGRAAR
jgi:hypothetical protein